jgi:CrcB protein
MESPDNRQGSTFSWLMTPTAQHGGRILSEPTAQPGGFFAPAIAFPYATLFENVTGSFVMGLLAAYFAFKGDATQHWRLFFTTGILGGYTTFSAFSLDVALHYERGELGLTALYILLSVGLAVGGLFAGLAVVRNFS